MISPSPTQQPPPPTSAEKTASSTPTKLRTGQTRPARTVKAIFRPFIKAIYYLIRFIRSHKLLCLIALLLLLASVFFTSYITTRTVPFGLGSDPVSYSLRNVSGGEAVKEWLYALRDGDTKTLQGMQAAMPAGVVTQLPDPAQTITQYSQTSGRVWKEIKVVGSYTQDDTTQDTYVEVNLAASATASTDTTIIFHFVTLQGRDQLFGVDLSSARKAIQ